MTFNQNRTGIGTATNSETGTERSGGANERAMRRVLWWLLGSTRGGENRLRIIRAIQDQPRNTNQLSTALDLNYKTVEHHLDRLVEHGVLLTNGDGYGTTYFLSDRLDRNLDVLETVVDEAGLNAGDA